MSQIRQNPSPSGKCLRSASAIDTLAAIGSPSGNCPFGWSSSKCKSSCPEKKTAANDVMIRYWSEPLISTLCNSHRNFLLHWRSAVSLAVSCLIYLKMIESTFLEDFLFGIFIDLWPIFSGCLWNCFFFKSDSALFTTMHADTGRLTFFLKCLKTAWILHGSSKLKPIN